jgi:hypothetical protein
LERGARLVALFGRPRPPGRRRRRRCGALVDVGLEERVAPDGSGQDHVVGPDGERDDLMPLLDGQWDGVDAVEGGRSG